RMIRATLLMNSGKYKEAAALYRQIVAEDKADISALMGLALAVEKVGRLKEAITIYRKVWEITKNPVVANNEAYLMAYVYPDAPDKLSEALKKADTAIQAYPQASSFRDTRGWILYLLGRKNEALYELRRAVKGLPLSPEIHYHLGVVETNANNRDLGQWHFQAVIDSAQAIEAKGGNLSVAEARAVKLAKEALKRMKSERQ
ncbi:MAG: tetratricopeptide repeat protein, partial [Planctomycetes bacterium]|nr:tetratricopeptide repeat protein [Planctomycetota bacterium]